jgi:hypothetical protein
MSARREKRLRALEKRVSKLEIMASAGYLESNLREELMKNAHRSMDSWWMRTSATETGNTENNGGEQNEVEKKGILRRIFGRGRKPSQKKGSKSPR